MRKYNIENWRFVEKVIDAMKEELDFCFSLYIDDDFLEKVEDSMNVDGDDRKSDYEYDGVYFECVKPQEEEITYDEDGNIEDIEVVEDAIYCLKEIDAVEFEKRDGYIKFYFGHNEVNDKNYATVFYELDGKEYKKEFNDSDKFMYPGNYVTEQDRLVIDNIRASKYANEFERLMRERVFNYGLPEFEEHKGPQRKRLAKIVMLNAIKALHSTCKEEIFDTTVRILEHSTFFKVVSGYIFTRFIDDDAITQSNIKESVKNCILEYFEGGKKQSDGKSSDKTQNNDFTLDR